MLLVEASDVFIEHMRFAVGDEECGQCYENRDSQGIGNYQGTITRTVLANCDIAWGVDETFQPYYPNNRMTVWRCALYEGLHFSWHSEGAHGCLCLHENRQPDDQLANRSSYIGNLFVNPGFLSRAPLLGDGTFGYYNNVGLSGGQNVAGTAQRGAHAEVMNNWFSRTGEEMREGTFWYNNAGPLPGFYTSGNYIRSGYEGSTGSANIAQYCRPAGLVMVSGQNACNLILKYAGCRPRFGATEFGGTLERIKKYVRYARDNDFRYDKMVMASYDHENMMGITRDWVERSNQSKWGSNPYVWSSSDASHPYTRVPGGFPSMANNSAAYQDPANPNTIPASDPYTGGSNPGYTVREMYLNKLARDVETG
jgi:hypothetical protein